MVLKFDELIIYKGKECSMASTHLAKFIIYPEFGKFVLVCEEEGGVWLTSFKSVEDLKAYAEKWNESFEREKK